MSNLSHKSLSHGSSAPHHKRRLSGGNATELLRRVRTGSQQEEEVEEFAMVASANTESPRSYAQPVPVVAAPPVSTSSSKMESLVLLVILHS